MRTAIKPILSLTVITLALPLLSFAQGKSIYGADNRMELFAAPADIQNLSGSVASLWRTTNVVFNPQSKTFTLNAANFGSSFNLCPDERFRDQPKGAFCSGSLVGPDLIMTAGHCLADAADCAATKIVFGFSVKKMGGQAPLKIAQNEVYNCKQIVKVLEGDADYSLIRLNRPVTGHKPLAVNRSSKLKNGDGVFVIGHPKGLPLKIADRATVRDIAPAGYFSTDLDTFSGNSGSPVFNAKTKLVEGILVRGGQDLEQNTAGCTSSSYFPQNGGRGEDVTKISKLQAFIPKLAAEKKAEAAVKANTIKAIKAGEVKALQGFDAENLFR
ncbi:MAG TPA: serine protease [Elusimicrobia bacterium]|nr:serine protease [Elusimicrobiota bacterium]